MYLESIILYFQVDIPDHTDPPCTQRKQNPRIQVSARAE